MKKLLSMVLALTTVFSSFAAIVKADDELPTVTVEITKIEDADEIEEVVTAMIDNGDIEDETELEGFTLFKLEAFMQGLELARQNTTKIAGEMLTGFELAANADMSNFGYYYVDSLTYPYQTFVVGSTGFALGWDATQFKNTKSFPSKGQTVDPTEPTLFYTAYVYVVEGTVFTVATSSFATDTFANGTSQAAMVGYDYINYPATLTFGAVPPPPAFKYYDAGAVDLEGLDDVAVKTLTKNYGTTQFTKEIDPLNKRYFIVATDANGVTNEDEEHPFEISFGARGTDSILETNGTVSFYALVKSATHRIRDIAIKEVAR